jgi:hypothetical protein
MKYLMRCCFFVLIVFVFALLAGCAGGTEVGNPIIPPNVEEVPGDCTYMEVQGTAIIVSISHALPTSNNCGNNAAEVVFDFYPDDETNSQAQINGQLLTVGDGLNPSIDYLALKGIQVGSKFKCVRKDIIKGDCDELLFTFPELDLSDYESFCSDK